MNRNQKKALLLLGALMFAVLLAVVTPTPPIESEQTGIQTFQSPSDFHNYINNSQSQNQFYVLRGGAAGIDGAPQVELTAESTEKRHSTTNVQEVGIMEPDILKTDGSTAYFSHERRYYIGMPDHIRKAQENTTVINVSTPQDPTIIGKINTSGNLFLLNNSLIVLTSGNIQKYDVSSSENPTEGWSKNIEGRIVTARMYNNKIYLVTQNTLRPGISCPVEPLTGASIHCTQIYRPSKQIHGNTMITVSSINPSTGDIVDTESFMGAHSSTVYMSNSSIYVTYPLQTKGGELYLDFLLSNKETFNQKTSEDLERLETYELSDRALRIEAQHIVNQWLSSLEKEEREKQRENLRKEYKTYLQNNMRDLQKTGIMEFNIDKDTAELSVGDTGEVPGRPLNQWSLDEYKGKLRVSTTVEAGRTIKSENDVYVLDEDLDIIGEIQGMGIDEEVYSVRFMEDTAYVVTFRRIDPFHVIDLENPEKPVLQGKLKLPGFSSYLHPLPQDRILGVGEEEGDVKAVVFNVSNSRNPKVSNSFILDDDWSSVRESHHAFLEDKKHDIVFVPGETGGHIFSYSNNSFSKIKTIESEGAAKRAMYIDDYLYVFSDRELIVVNENTWEQVKSLQIKS